MNKELKSKFHVMPKEITGEKLQELRNGFNKGEYTLDDVIVRAYYMACKADEWVSVATALPKDKSFVIIYRWGIPQVGYYCRETENDYWVAEGVSHIDGVTHWKPLTPPNQ